MPKVEISGTFLRNEALMIRVVNAGFTLKNKQYNARNDTYTFDIEGHDVPDCDSVDLILNDEKIWCQKQKPFKITTEGQQILELLKKPPTAA